VEAKEDKDGQLESRVRAECDVISGEGISMRRELFQTAARGGIRYLESAKSLRETLSETHRA
jgi:hypothetical protein